MSKELKHTQPQADSFVMVQAVVDEGVEKEMLSQDADHLRGKLYSSWFKPSNIIALITLLCGLFGSFFWWGSKTSKKVDRGSVKKMFHEHNKKVHRGAAKQKDLLKIRDSVSDVKTSVQLLKQRMDFMQKTQDRGFSDVIREIRRERKKPPELHPPTKRKRRRR